MSKCWLGKPCCRAACWQHASRCCYGLSASQQFGGQEAVQLAVNGIAMCHALGATGWLSASSLGSRHPHAWQSMASPWVLP